MDFSIAKMQKSGRFPQRSVEPFFHNIFEFRLQISRSQDPPVFGLSHMVKTTSILNFNRDENQMIFKNVFEFRLQISRSRDPPVCALSQSCFVLLCRLCVRNRQNGPDRVKNAGFQDQVGKWTFITDQAKTTHTFICRSQILGTFRHSPMTS